MNMEICQELKIIESPLRGRWYVELYVGYKYRTIHWNYL